MNSYHYGRREHESRGDDRESGTLGLVVLIPVLCGIVYYLLTARYHLRPRQIVEALIYLGCLLLSAWLIAQYAVTYRKKRMAVWPQPRIHVPLLKDREETRKAHAQNAVVGGYATDLKTWAWSDEIRRLQALLLGGTGAGKTTFLRSILAQDMRRSVRGRRIPIIVIDCKADADFRKALEEQARLAGRSHQFRVLDPTRPEISMRWNPLSMTVHSYDEHINFIFESFGLRKDFFEGHQYSYFGDLVRVLYYAGKPFNVYDVLVAAQDQQVLEQQIGIARNRIRRLYAPDDQRRLNLDMSVHNLRQSFESKERVEKIQGLLNELMTFIQDKLSIVTGPYEDLLTLEEVIERELILYVSLNVSLNTKAVTALGRMLLHNLQMLAGKRYQGEKEDLPFVSVVLDEFSPLAYPDFAHIIQTARGSNIAILFCLQSVSQLEKVSTDFCRNVCSAPNTVILMRCRHDDETAKYFQTSSSLVKATRTTRTVEERGWIEKALREIPFGSNTEVLEYRAKDEQIRNFPTGQFQVLATNHETGTEFLHLHLRPMPEWKLDCFHPVSFPCTYIPAGFTDGANLRFTDPELIERNARAARLKGRGNQAR